MGDLAKVFWDGRDQAVRLPEQFRVEGSELRISREGRKIVLEPVEKDMKLDRPARRARRGCGRGRARTAGTGQLRTARHRPRLMLYSLDTNAVIALMSGEPAGVRARLTGLAPDDAGVSTIVLHELLWAPTRARRSNGIARGSPNCVCSKSLSTPRTPARRPKSARICVKGTPMGPYDVLIAGQAMARGLTVVTANLQEFGRVEGLKMKNWTAGSLFAAIPGSPLTRHLRGHPIPA